MKKMQIKSPSEIEKMRKGGAKLGGIKEKLKRAIHQGVSAAEIENLAQDLIRKSGAESSFAMVPGYSWATCINVNDGVVHGIPKSELVFREGDLVSVDVGIYYLGFHTDTSFTVLIGQDKEKEMFLQVGQTALQKAISNAVPGNSLGDISAAMESCLLESKCSPIRALVGHGIGKNLHEDPMIPCYTGYSGESLKLVDGMALAIEVMYAQGSHEVKTDKDGWTIRTKDGKMAALFEETVALTKAGPVILTK